MLSWHVCFNLLLEEGSLQMSELREGTLRSWAFWTGALSTFATLITAPSSSEEYDGLALRRERDLRRDRSELPTDSEEIEESVGVSRLESEEDGNEWGLEVWSDLREYEVWLGCVVELFFDLSLNDVLKELWTEDDEVVLDRDDQNESKNLPLAKKQS